MSESTRTLIVAATAGEPAAIDELVARNLPRLHAYVRLHMGAKLRAREGSLDVVQSVCREVLGDLGGFEYRGQAPFVRWLFTCALNKLRERDRFQHRAMRDVAREQPEDQLPADAYATLLTPSRDAIGREELGRVEAAFDNLPDDYREVIALARILGFSHREIAAEMGRSETAVRTLLGRALVRLATELRRLNAP